MEELIAIDNLCRLVLAAATATTRTESQRWVMYLKKHFLHLHVNRLF